MSDRPDPRRMPAPGSVRPQSLRAGFLNNLLISSCRTNANGVLTRKAQRASARCALRVVQVVGALGTRTSLLGFKKGRVVKRSGEYVHFVALVALPEHLGAALGTEVPLAMAVTPRT
jgi:hypothetical protein